MSTFLVCHQAAAKGLLQPDSLEEGLTASDQADVDKGARTSIFSTGKLQLVNLKWMVPQWHFPSTCACGALQQRGELLSWKMPNST